MRNLFAKLLSDSFFNSGISITAFSISHIIYMLIICTGIVLATHLIKGKGEETREKLLRFLAYALTISYVLDFFTHDFVYGEMNIDKLPFHLCTVMCPVIAFTQFNKKFEKLIEPVTFLAIVGPLMYLTYPASIGSGEPWCYRAVQTMFFHGVELAWGIINITSGKVKPEIKNCWKSAVGLGIITLWAKFGNLLFDMNWFFLEEDAFYIGLVSGGIIPKWSLMIFTPCGVFLVVLAIYGIYYAVKAIINKKNTASNKPITE